MTLNPSDKQPAGRYPPTFLLASLPDEVDPWACNHAAGECFCAHDWRIVWGNVPKKQKVRNVYVTT